MTNASERVHRRRSIYLGPQRLRLSRCDAGAFRVNATVNAYAGMLRDFFG